MILIHFPHQGCKANEIFFDYCSEEKASLGVPILWKVVWKSLRLGDFEINKVHGRGYPVFIDIKEIRKAGLTPSFLKGN